MGSYTIRDCCKGWAAFNEGDVSVSAYRRSGSVSYECEGFYSYSTLVARYYGGADRRYVLLTSFKHSVTTAHHISQARRAASVPCFVVPYVGAADIPAMHKDNLRHLLDGMAETERAAVRNFKHRSSTPYHIERLLQQQIDVLNYCRLTGTRHRHVLPADKLKQRVEDAVNAKCTAYTDPKAVTRRVRAAARREAILAFELGDK